MGREVRRAKAANVCDGDGDGDGDGHDSHPHAIAILSSMLEEIN